MPPKKKAGFVDWRDDWRNCMAKKLLIKDLERGRIPLSATEMTAEVAHQHRPEYHEVDFEKFKHHFENLHKSMTQQKSQATRDSEGLARDKQLRAASTAAAAATQPTVAAERDVTYSDKIKKTSTWRIKRLTNSRFLKFV
jgi:hypothetical protein